LIEIHLFTEQMGTSKFYVHHLSQNIILLVSIMNVGIFVLPLTRWGREVSASWAVDAWFSQCTGLARGCCHSCPC